jgi:hypothetical protein
MFFSFFLGLLHMTSKFQFKLNTHLSNLNSIFVIMSELKFFFVDGVLTQNFNIVDLVEFLEKNKKHHM